MSFLGGCCCERISRAQGLAVYKHDIFLYIIQHVLWWFQEGGHICCKARIETAWGMPKPCLWDLSEPSWNPLVFQWSRLKQTLVTKGPWLCYECCLYRDEQLPTYIYIYYRDYNKHTISHDKDPVTWSNQYNGMSVFKVDVSHLNLLKKTMWGKMGYKSSVNIGVP